MWLAQPLPSALTRDRPRFAQVSDSHIGFTGAPNPDVTATFRHAIDQINNLGYTPDFVIHTGDLTHLSSPDQFDQAKQMLSGLRTPHVLTVPGEHDPVDDAVRSTAAFLARQPKATVGTALTSLAST